MQIKHLRINNFRGIKQLEWSIQSSVVCLIGPGDATKSTILDAIEYVLSPYWNVMFEDCDFYLADRQSPIEIVITIGQVPDELLTENKFGLFQRGWHPGEGIHDEPLDGDEPVLSVRLVVDHSLEPEWSVINDRETEGRKISAKDREKLRVTRLGEGVDKHLSWRRGSALLSLTNSRNSANYSIIEASRQAQKTAKLEDVDEFVTLAQRAKDEAAKLGVKPKTDFRPALDMRAIQIGVGAVSIHDGDIPARLMGTGSRRLVSLGLQLASVSEGAILLIDEVEHGLEPHRLRHLLYHLQNLDNSGSTVGQIFMTSHSHTTIVELGAEKLHIVRSSGGITNIRQVRNNLQGVVRSVPEAFLGRKVIVCEGKTEYGFCRSIARHWQDRCGFQPLAYLGAGLVERGGDSASKISLELASLGYQTCLFIDSDKLNSLNPSIQTLRDTGVFVIHWDGTVAIEQRVALDLPWAVLKKMLSLAVRIKDEEDINGEHSVFDKLCSSLERDRGTMGTEIDTWLNNGFSEEQIRNAIGNSAKSKGWFKRIDHGEELGNLVAGQLETISTSDSAIKMQQLNQWIYG